MGQGYHNLSVSEVERHFGVDIFSGLSEAAAKSNREKYGRNSIERIREIKWWQVFLRQFNDFFIILLAIAATISWRVDGALQALILAVIIVINVLLGFFQEYKAEKALLELKQTFRGKTKVLRGGTVKVIDNEDLTLGDIVLFEAGDKVPADLRIAESESLRVDESTLTGESLPLSKIVDTLPDDKALADRRNMLYASTLVSAGRGKAIVTAVGQETEFGKIAEMVHGASSSTPLEHQIAYLGKVITLISLFVAVLVFVLGALRGLEIWPLLTFVIALLVAAVPESLPTAITLALAIGVARMVKKKAIIRQMAAIETLGTVNVIATDKTGTLTNNELNLNTISLLERGVWERYLTEERGHNSLHLREAIVKGLLCSNIVGSDVSHFIGDPVEVAIAKKANLFKTSAFLEVKRYRRLLEIPFDSDKKYMAVLVKHNNQSEMIVKGMPEKVISFCNLNPKGKKIALAEAAELSRNGLKVIALAVRSGGSAKMLSGMRLIGFLAMVDEPTAGIRKAITDAVRAGIRPMIITGDHPETARFVAEKIGLVVGQDEIMTGTELEKLSAKDLRQAVSKVQIFARITPGDKIKIVRTLKELGYTVAVTGDGVNDAPAIKEAHVGIAMGIKGTDVSRSAADVVLADDRYQTILSAVEYGRAIYDNIRNVIVHLLSGNLNEIALVGVAFLFGLPSPITTLQILWVNMVTDSLPALALSYGKPSSLVLAEQPRSAAKESLRAPVAYALYLSLVSFVLCLAVYFWGLRTSPARAQAMTFTFFVLIELTFCFSLRSKKRFWQSLASFFENKLLIAALGISLLLQFMLFAKPFRDLFELGEIGLREVGELAVATLIAFVAAELIRFAIDRKQK